MLMLQNIINRFIMNPKESTLISPPSPLTRNMLKILFTLFITLTLSTQAQGKSFNAEGSDLLIGVGADAIGLSGAVSAGTSNIYSLYWNPAGLAEMDESELSISGLTNSKLLPVNFIGAAFSTDWLKRFGLKSTIALSWIPRLYFEASGAYTEADFESIFIRFALPGLPGSFSGNIRSKTKDNRISLALMPVNEAKWSLGLSVARIDCETFFCGVTASQPGVYTMYSTKATAYALNMGGKYYYSPELTFAFNFKDIDTSLNVDVTKVLANGTEEQMTFHTAFPRDLTLGTAWLYSSDLKLSLDYQMMFSNYGDYELDFRILRSGLSYSDNDLTYRFGILAPLMLKTNKASDYTDTLQFPVAPSVGIGWHNDYLSLDAALYAQLIMSAQRKKVTPGLDVSLSYIF